MGSLWCRREEPRAHRGETDPAESPRETRPLLLELPVLCEMPEVRLKQRNLFSYCFAGSTSEIKVWPVSPGHLCPASRCGLSPVCLCLWCLWVRVSSSRKHNKHNSPTRLGLPPGPRAAVTGSPEALSPNTTPWEVPGWGFPL